jgi:uncharacterized protein (DUF488 family)
MSTRRDDTDGHGGRVDAAGHSERVDAVGLGGRVDAAGHGERVDAAGHGGRVDAAGRGGRVYTIGHGGRSAEELLDQLRGAGVDVVVDVRSAPYSRYQPEFSKKPLGRFLTRNGTRYVYMGKALGGRPPDSDCYTGGEVDYAKCRKKESFRQGIEAIRRMCRKGLRPCLLCSEAKPSRCHRSRLIGTALAEQGQGIEVCHLLSDGRVLTQKEVIDELTGGQCQLFDDPFDRR